MRDLAAELDKEAKRQEGAARAARAEADRSLAACSESAFAVAAAPGAFPEMKKVPPRTPRGGVLAELREGWWEFASKPWL